MNSVLPSYQAQYNPALADTLDRMAALTTQLAVFCDEAYEQLWRMPNDQLCVFLNEVGDYDAARLFELHNIMATACNLTAEFTNSRIKCKTEKPTDRFFMTGHRFVAYPESGIE